MTGDSDRPRQLEGRNKLLRVFIGELDKVHGQPLHEAIVHAAHREGMAGVTVLRGVAAYGASSRLHTAKVLRLSEDLPILVEIVDTEAHVEGFLKTLDGLLEASGCGGLITLEAVEVIRYFPRNH
jgi:PII-like signaling protein